MWVHANCGGGEREGHCVVITGTKVHHMGEEVCHMYSMHDM